jgi:CheY-like chemotaxis protein
MQLNSKRILYIEDDLNDLTRVRLLLEQHGVKVKQSSGENALTLLESYLPIDLILLDLTLRGKLSGYDIFEMIRADPRFADIPIVATSAEVLEVEMNRARMRGFTGFISKPIHLLHFSEQIAKILEGKSVWI